MVAVMVIGGFGCGNGVKDSAPKYTVTIEDHATKPYKFPEGIYYAYDVPAPGPGNFNAEDIIKKAEDAGVRLRDAWFKNCNTPCTPPGGNIAMPAKLKAAIVVRVEKEAPELLKLGFSQTTEPNVGWCAFRVSHYHFED
ncbi:hypothetical protein TRIP_C21048 [Candidatus Zixiibacteriota bacterium]|nr:hypothetical protein TRIP_C21048 [candidate division Zixibacteria bacterium]